MAFLDNSGDIILDAVLTDHGRKLLAQGDGSFEITQFALADDEIDYSLYEKNHTSGSAYYDLQILQTPVFEAFTNNSSSVKNKLVSFENLELLFLPIIKLNKKTAPTKMHSTGTYIIAADGFTEDDNGSTESEKGIVQDSSGVDQEGILRGETLTGDNHIRIDQGLDTGAEGAAAEISPSQSLGNMVETEYTVQMDSRLGHLATVNGDILTEDYIDDDHIAFYTVAQGDTTNQIVSLINDTDPGGPNSAINGPRGTKLMFKIKSSMELQTSTFLFQRLGAETTLPNRSGSSSSNLYYIDTMIRITGIKTGQSMDVPVRFVKYKST